MSSSGSDSDDVPFAAAVAGLGDDDTSDESQLMDTDVSGSDASEKGDDDVAAAEVGASIPVPSSAEAAAAAGGSFLPTASVAGRAKQPKRAQPKPPGEPKAKVAGKGAAAAAKPKKVKQSQDEVTAIVAAWFAKENKPAIAVSLVAALGSKISKPMVQKALDDLLSRGTITIKEIKKAVVYYPCQSQFTALSASDALDLKLRCDAAATRCTELEAEFRELTARKLQLGMTTSTAQLRLDLAAAEETNAKLARRLGISDAHVAARPVAPTISRSDMVDAVSRFMAMKKLWQQRRRLGWDVIESFAIDKRPAEVVADLDLELDSPDTVAAIQAARIPPGLVPLPLPRGVAR